MRLYSLIQSTKPCTEKRLSFIFQFTWTILLCLRMFVHLPPQPSSQYSAFICWWPLSALNISGSHFLPLSLLQAIPIPVARKENSSTLGKYHKCAETDPLLGDHPEWASPTWGLPCLPGHPHPKSEDHCPRPGGGPQEHTSSQVRGDFTPQVGVMLLFHWWWW